MTTNCAVMAPRDVEKVWAALDDFRIEVPSWGFANTGTRFGKVLQDGAATNIEEKFADAAQVNDLTGASPTVALHVLWDLPRGVVDASVALSGRMYDQSYEIGARPADFQRSRWRF